MTKTQPVALGFNNGQTALDELRNRVSLGHHDFGIMLAGGAALSRKTITLRKHPTTPWVIHNHVDNSQQFLGDDSLWTHSNIGEALDKRALLDLDGDEGLTWVLPGHYVATADWLADERERVKAYQTERFRLRTENPLALKLEDGPGAIRMPEITPSKVLDALREMVATYGSGDMVMTPDERHAWEQASALVEAALSEDHVEHGEWEPGDPVLMLDVCDIGPATVASIDLEATSFDGKAASTSIELTIEDIDELIATLSAIRADAIANRGFAIRENGWWSNGRE